MFNTLTAVHAPSLVTKTVPWPNLGVVTWGRLTKGKLKYVKAWVGAASA
jgi:hypothetical protein